MFDPRSPYQRRMWHYESDRPLSVAQLIAAGSLDSRAAALLWLLVERRRSIIVSGPTDPTPGVGKTTTMNALLGFLPIGSTMVYTMGMFEDFSFVSEVEAATTCVLANEVSDHLRIYMWGRSARALLRLPEDGFAVATSCHADTIDDVLSMLRNDLRLTAEDVRRLGVIINIGLVGARWPQQRRFLTINYVRPAGGDDQPYGVSLAPLATWDERSDGFIPGAPEVMEELAGLLEMTPEDSGGGAPATNRAAGHAGARARRRPASDAPVSGPAVYRGKRCATTGRQRHSARRHRGRRGQMTTRRR